MKHAMPSARRSAARPRRTFSRALAPSLMGLAAYACLGVLAGPAAAADDAGAAAPDPVFSPSLTYDGTAARVARGGTRTGSAYVGNLHLRLLAKAPADSPWAGTTAFADVLDIHGSNASPSTLAGVAQNVSNIEGPHGTHIEELWVQHNFAGSGVSLLAGIYDLNSEFYRLQSAGLFLNSSFGIGPEFAQSGVEGPSIFPRTSAGVRISAKPAPGVVLRAAVLDGVPVVRPDGTNGLFRSGDGLLGVAEAAFLSRPNAAEDDPSSARQSLGRFSALPPYVDKLAFGLWRYTGRYPDIGPPDPVQGPGLPRPSSGGYAVGEARILGREPDAKRTLSAFAQLGLASTATNRFGSYVGGGLVGTGWIPGRDSDQIGISIASARNGSPYLNAQQALGQPVSRAETTIELSYLTQLTKWLSVQPDLQYVRHPNTDPMLSNAWVAQLRFELAF